MNLEVLEFIRSHSEDWRELLAQKPYCVTVKDSGNYTMLSYSHIDSDFNYQITRECRGLIIRKQNNDYCPVCVGFMKFGNLGESYCPDIDWSSAQVQEKIDGSLIRLWYDDGKWRVSTSGMICAEDAAVGDAEDGRGNVLTFGSLFMHALRNTSPSVLMDFFYWLDKNCTYMFEVVSPASKVIVPYSETKLFHIGTRNNETLEEFETDICIPKPRLYPLRCIEECKEFAAALQIDANGGEGFVVVDKFYNRIKIKNPKYVRFHAMLNNNVITYARIIDMFRHGDVDEFLIYFPKYKERFEAVGTALEEIEAELIARKGVLDRQHFESQKEFAAAIYYDDFKSYFFEWRKTGISPKEWLWRMPSSRLAEYVEEWISND